MSNIIKAFVFPILLLLFLHQTQYQVFFHIEAVEHDGSCNNDNNPNSCINSENNNNDDNTNPNDSYLEQKEEAVTNDEEDITTIPSLHQYEDRCQCLPHVNIYKEQNFGGEGGEENEEQGARIAYLITLHNQRTLKQSLTLLKSIIAPEFIVLIHIDTKFPKEEYEDSALMHFINDRGCNCCGADVEVASVHAATWGEWSMLEPTLWAMDELSNNLRYKNKWDTFINISADSMPVYTPKILSQYFHGPLKDINFVTSSSCATGLIPTHIDHFPSGWHKAVHYKEKGKFEISFNSHHDYDHEQGDEESKSRNTSTSTSGEEMTETIDLKIHFGSQWMTLTPAVVKYISSSMTKSDSLPYRFKQELIQRQRLMADETFIPTLLVHHSTFRKTLPTLLRKGNLASTEKFFAIRYERMDENMPDAFMNVVEKQRYDVPQSYKTIIDVPKPWGPYYLGIYDLASIKDSGALFIRKVAKEIDSNMFKILPVNDRDEIPHIEWPKEVEVSEKIDWWAKGVKGGKKQAMAMNYEL